MNNNMIDFNEGSYTFYVYIITNTYRSTFYTGMTNNLHLRLWQHSENIEKGNKTFASKYNLRHLVFYEKFSWVQHAIEREKEIKSWRRDKKLELIRSFNPNFEFLNDRFTVQGNQHISYVETHNNQNECARDVIPPSSE